MKRRRLVSATVGVGAITLSGCLSLLSNSDKPVEEIFIEFDNRTTESHVFHIAVETDGGLGEWESQTVDGESQGNLRIEPPLRDGSFDVHGIVSNRTARGTITTAVSDDIDINVTCPRMKLRYDEGELDFYQNFSKFRC